MSKRTERESEHPTRILITSVAAEVLKEQGPGEFRVDDVLERTGLTRGALYHHFDNVDDLVDSALIATYSEGVGATIEFVRVALASATTFEQFRDGVFQANINYVTNEGLQALRRLRAHTMANADGRMADHLAVEQQRLTDEYVSVIVSAKDQGWVRQNVDPLALAVFIQAYSFGIIIDDISGTHLDARPWAELIEAFFTAVVFEPLAHDSTHLRPGSA